MKLVTYAATKTAADLKRGLAIGLALANLGQRVVYAKLRDSIEEAGAVSRLEKELPFLQPLYEPTDRFPIVKLPKVSKWFAAREQAPEDPRKLAELLVLSFSKNQLPKERSELDTLLAELELGWRGDSNEPPDYLLLECDLSLPAPKDFLFHLDTDLNLISLADEPSELVVFRSILDSRPELIGDVTWKTILLRSRNGYRPSIKTLQIDDVWLNNFVFPDESFESISSESSLIYYAGSMGMVKLAESINELSHWREGAMEMHVLNPNGLVSPTDLTGATEQQVLHAARALQGGMELTRGCEVFLVCPPRFNLAAVETPRHHFPIEQCGDLEMRRELVVTIGSFFWLTATEKLELLSRDDLPDDKIKEILDYNRDVNLRLASEEQYFWRQNFERSFAYQIEWLVVLARELESHKNAELDGLARQLRATFDKILGGDSIDSIAISQENRWPLICAETLGWFEESESVENLLEFFPEGRRSLNRVELQLGDRYFDNPGPKDSTLLRHFALRKHGYTACQFEIGAASEEKSDLIKQTIKTFHSAVKIFPDDWDALAKIAVSYRKRGEFADSDVEKIAWYERAMAIFENVIEREPNFLRCVSILAAIYTDCAEISQDEKLVEYYLQSIKYYKRVRGLKPNHEFVDYNIGYGYAMLGNNSGVAEDQKAYYDAAVEYFEASTLLYPEDADSFWSLGFYLNRRGILEIREAQIPYLERAISVTELAIESGLNNEGRLFRNLGLFLLNWHCVAEEEARIEFLDRATRAYYNAIDLEPSNANGYADQASAFLYRGKCAQNKTDRVAWLKMAIENVEKAVELAKDLSTVAVASSACWLSLSHCVAADESRQCVQKAYDILIDHYEENPKLRYNMCCVYALNDRHEDSLAILRNCIEDDPEEAYKASRDEDFVYLAQNPEFKKLISPYQWEPKPK